MAAQAQAKPGVKSALKKSTRPTAEQRRQARIEAEQQEAAAERAFEAERPQHFARLFTKALRIALTMRGYPEVVEANDWWFNRFSVDPRKCTFTCQETHEVDNSVESLRKRQAERLEESLDMALRWFDEHDAWKEQKRQEALILQQKRQAALDKLTNEDKAVLNLPLR